MSEKVDISRIQKNVAAAAESAWRGMSELGFALQGAADKIAALLEGLEKIEAEIARKEAANDQDVERDEG